jgi:hypothetical protein
MPNTIGVGLHRFTHFCRGPDAAAAWNFQGTLPVGMSADEQQAVRSVIIASDRRHRAHGDVKRVTRSV